jgi:NitT/TauT family transport system substrate-binding protein
MHDLSRIDLGRRNCLIRASAIAASSVLAPYARLAAADAEPEIKKLRLVHAPSICVAPQYLAEELLRLEGFTEIQYLPLGSRNGPYAIADGRADITMWDTPGLLLHLDADKPIVLLAGIHSGCYELFGNERVQSIRDLKGKTVAIQYFGGGDHVLLSSMLAYVGMRPQEDIKWLPGPNIHDGMTYFVEGKADAFLAYTPHPQELRALKVGHVIIDTAKDRPWSQYFCCVVAANKDFVQRYPIATKRVLRAILKAADLCAADPKGVARYLYEHGYEKRYDIAVDALKSIRYERWREANPEDTIRFHALRLYEVGMIKTNPNKLIERGTDWRALNELKKELKG